MTDEALINRLYDVVDEITRIGGEQERTSITPGILVADANPSDLPTGYIKIVNPRDGGYVPCLTINGLVVSDNDLVNVLFTKGTEPIALSQSANSPSNTLKVSEVWESDFGAVALEADVSGNLTLNGTRTLTIPTDLIHAGDPNTLLSFTDDDVEITAGGLSMLKLTEAGQDLITLGPGSGDVDIDFNGDMFLRGSDGEFGIGTSAPETTVHILKSGTPGTPTTLGRTSLLLQHSGAAGNFSAMSIIGGASGASIIDFGDTADADVGSIQYFHSGNFFAFVTNTTEKMRITSSGNVGINGVTSPSTELDIGDGAIEFEEMTAPAAGAANTARLFTQDNGAGKTQLAVRFNTGAIQILATEP